jgi:DNA repair photolyase
VWGFFGPVLPCFTDTNEEIAEMLRAMAAAGAGHVLVDAMNLYPGVVSGVRSLLARAFPEQSDRFEAVRSDHGRYLSELSDRVSEAAHAVDVEVEVCF